MGIEAGFPARLSKWENRHDPSLLQIFVVLTKKPIPFISQYKHLNALNSTRQKHSNLTRRVTHLFGQFMMIVKWR